MKLFYDTSAWVPLVLRESASTAMWEVKQAASEIWAWGWMRVETEAALTRRRAAPSAWKNWHLLKSELCWVELQPDQTDTLCAFNRAIGLRAADVGHLFVFDRLFSELPDLLLLTLDAEMATAARRIGLPLHPASA
jgi:hypothetical protein